MSAPPHGDPPPEEPPSDDPPISISRARRNHTYDRRTPPHNIETQESLLGAMLLTGDATETAHSIITADDLYGDTHPIIYTAILALHLAGQPCDPITVADRLRRQGLLEQAGGLGTLIALQASCPATGSAGRYARIVEDLARCRQLIATATELTELGYSTPEDIPAALEQAEAKVAAIRRHTNSTSSTWQPVDLGPAVRGEHTGPEPGILHRTDRLGLFYPGKVHVVAGEPESGKSWLVQLAAVNCLQRGERVVYIDFEDDETGVVARLLALGATRQQILDQFTYMRPDQAIDNTNGQLLDQACTGATLAIVDGVTEGMAIHGWEPKSDSDSAKWQQAILRRIAAHGCAVVAIDHVAKDKETRGRWSTGSQHKLAGINGVQYNVETRKPWAPGRTGSSRIVVAKDRPGRVRAGLEDLRTVGDMNVSSYPDGGVSITIDPVRPEETATDGGHRPTVLMGHVTDYLAAHGGGPESTKRVRLGVKGRAVNIDRALDVLELEGFVTSEKVGNGLHWTLLKPFTNTPTAPTTVIEEF